jgi:beta-lactamase class C
MGHKKAGLALLVVSAIGLMAVAPWLTAVERKAAPASSSAAAPASEARATTPSALPRTASVDATPAAREIERLAGEIVAQKQLPGLALAIVQNGKVVSLRGYGVTDTSTGEAVGTDTVFRLASLSKSFAATVSAQLVEEGAMGWDSPIINQLPAFKLRDYQGAQRVTVRDVLSHRVGITRNTYDRDLENNSPYPLLAERLSDAPMACTPGDCYAYQNIAFSLIGDLVFAATGDFYAHQVEKRIFHPLGMHDATYGREGLEASRSWARPHVRRGRSWMAVRPKETYYRVPPAAGVNASIHDMAQWLIAQTGYRPDVLSPDLLNTTHTPQVLTPGELRGSGWRRERLNNAYYALGWRVFDYSGHTLVFHGGAVQGYRGLAALLPDQNLGVVVLWNSESAAPSGLLPSLIDRVLGLPPRDWLGIDSDAEQD